jgi:DNA-binding response OmpR family regulator
MSLTSLNAHAECLGEYTVTLDDDPVICRLIEEIVGVQTFSFSDSAYLMEKASDLHPVGVFVDIHLSKNSCGLDVIPDLRALWPAAPLIVITGDEDDKLVGRALAAGASDFLQKPFRAADLLARFNARREELRSRVEINTIRYADITLDVEHRKLSGPLGTSFVSSRDVGILSYFMRSNGMVIPKDEIKTKAWGSISVTTNALDRKIFEIRKMIEAASETVELKSIYGKGIVLRLRSFEDDKILIEDKKNEIGRYVK